MPNISHGLFSFSIFLHGLDVEQKCWDQKNCFIELNFLVQMKIRVELTGVYKISIFICRKINAVCLIFYLFLFFYI